ncbi:Tat pathway signal sequence domain protein [Streptomyces sp. NPDC048442]|uniref:exo-rhamnogalacturonan lyase family protein n=1 Tax=Streptomyces sp. NPDC048442 TaxID=3154823 RepID=UPI00344A814A
MSDLPRRTLLKATAATSAATLLSSGTAGTAGTATAAGADTKAGAGPVTLQWLDPTTPGTTPGTTLGVPWPKGAHPKIQTFALITADGKPVPVQSWPLAQWPDGSLKWSAHAVAPAPAGETYTLSPVAPNETPAAPTHRITVTKNHGTIDISTGVITARLGTNGSALVKSVTRDRTEIARDGRLVLLRQGEIEDGDQSTTSTATERFESVLTKTEVEQSGPVRAVVRIDGKHRRGRRSWMPFSVRLYFYAGGESFRMVHTVTYDGTQEPGKASGDFVRGLGVRFTVPMRDASYDRHVRLGGDGTGLLREAVKGVTGLRRDPGIAVQNAQFEGQKTADPATWDQRVTSRLHLIPEWGDYTLSQLSADGFTLRKRTKRGHGWIAAGGGRRASGYGYVGGPSGGLSFGLRDFWEKHPAGIDVRGAHTDAAEVTLWLWSPEAPPMDLRFYHDGLGQDTYAEQLEGLNITYEDYESGFGTPFGIARTSELHFWAHGSTPAPATHAREIETVRNPPQLVAPPAQLIAAKVFGGLFAAPDRSTPAKAKIEDHLDFLFTYYRDQVDMRRWYGFWDYGDVMHSYDPVRHQWRYDVGGYAWDNSELSPDLWLWYAYLRSGRADIFRFAEAMTRHTGEVDVYHLGKWAGLGTRHGIQHYADSAKQQRIANTTYRRIYYFLTADERTGDLMHANVDSDETFLALDPIRKIRTELYTPDRHALSIGFGTDWSGLVSAWLTEWERGGPKAAKAKARVLSTMETIAAQPNGFVQGTGLYDLDTGRFAVEKEAKVGVSHLSAVFGLNELCAELIDLVDMPEFKEAYLDYCRFFNATKAEQRARYGKDFGSLLLFQGHSRLDAYAAVQSGDAKLAERAWEKFYNSDGYKESAPWKTEKVTGPVTLVPGSEANWVYTNDTALYGLAAIENLALVGDRMP